MVVVAVLQLLVIMLVYLAIMAKIVHLKTILMVLDSFLKLPLVAEEEAVVSEFLVKMVEAVAVVVAVGAKLEVQELLGKVIMAEIHTLGLEVVEEVQDLLVMRPRMELQMVEMVWQIA